MSRFSAALITSVCCLVLAPTAGAQVNLADADVTVLGGSDTRFGWRISIVGDVNDDGFDDFVVGADTTDTDTLTDNGQLILVYGDDSLPTTIDPETAVAGEVTLINGLNDEDRLGVGCWAVGDFNDDGIADFAVGAPRADYEARDLSGIIYVIFGTSTLSDSLTFDLSTIDTDTGLILGGNSQGRQLGRNIFDAGDFNDDGIDDFIAMSSDDPLIVYGSTTVSGEVDTNDFFSGLDDGLGMKLNSAGFIPTRASRLGDFDGDSIDDVILGAFQAEPNGDDSGECYIVYGGQAGSGSPPTLELDEVGLDPGVDGVTLHGGFAGDEAGSSLAGIGDLNEDGLGDVLIAAQGANRGGIPDVGEVYLLYGSDALTSPLDLTTISSTEGITFRGSNSTDRVGRCVAETGDFDRDGTIDFLIGMSGYDYDGKSSGGMLFYSGAEDFPALVVGNDLFDLSTAYQGIDDLDHAGWRADGAGDINGDGGLDFISSATCTGRGPSSGTCGGDEGEVYVIYGTALLPVENLVCGLSGTEVNLTWDNGDTYDSIDLLEDGSVLASLAGTDTSYDISRASAGTHTYGITAFKDGLISDTVECTLNVVVLPVQNLSCFSDGTDVVLNWTNGQSYSTGVEVLRDGILLDTLQGTDETFSEPIPIPGIYEYTVRGVNGGDASTDTLCTVTVPITPEDLVCTVDGTSVTLEWTNVETYDDLQVFRDGTLVVTRPGDETSFTELGVPSGLHTYDLVSVVDGNASEPISCMVGVVEAVTDLACSADGDTATLTWTNPITYDSIQVLLEGTLIVTLAGDATTHVEPALALGPQQFSVVGVLKTILADAVDCDVTVLTDFVAFDCSAIDDTVFLSWDRGEDYDGVEVYRDEALLATLAGTANTYSDTDVAAGVHDYELVGTITGSSTNPIDCAIEVLDPPTGLNCILDGDEVTLEWMNGSTYDEIELRRNGSFLTTLLGTDTTYSETVPPGTFTYTVVGRVTNSETSSTCEVGDPGAPFNLACSVAGEDADVTWENDDLYDEIKIFVDDVEEAVLAGDATSATIAITEGDHTICVVGFITNADSSPACCDVHRPLGMTDVVCFSTAETVFLTWINAEAYDSIDVLRDGVLVTTLLGSQESFNDTSVPAGTLSYDVVPSIGTASTTVTCETAVLEPIADLTCSAGAGDVTLTFTPGETYGEIEVYRNSVFVASLLGNDTTYVDAGVSAGSYDYVLVGITGDNQTADVLCTVNVPLSPFGLTCDLDGGETVQLNWNNSQLGDSIEVERDGVVVGTLAAAASTFSDTPVDTGTFDYCVVNIINGNRSVGACCSVIVPTAPEGFACSSEGGGVELLWTNPEGYDSILIERNGTLIAVIPGSVETFFDDEVDTGSYDYSLVGFVDGFSSVEAECMVTIPLAVTDLACSFNGVSADLSWTVPITYDTIVIYRNGFELDSVSGDSTTYIDASLPSGLYDYTIIGVVGTDESTGADCRLEVLLPPFDLACRSQDDSVFLDWENGQTYDELSIVREGVVIATLTGAETSYEDAGAIPGSYSYCVRGGDAGSASRDACCTVTVVEPPADVTCTADGSTVALTWTNPEIYSFVTVRRNGTTVVTLGGTATEFTEIGLTPAAYDYEIVGQSGLDSATSDICEASVVTPPTVECSARGGTTTVVLTTPGGVTYDSFHLLRDGIEIVVLDGTETEYDDPDLESSDYTYSLQGEIAGSLSDTVSCEVTVLTQIQGLSCSTVAEEAFLSWTNGQIYDEIQVLRDGEVIVELSGTSNSHLDLDLTGDHDYEIIAVGTNTETSPTLCSVAMLAPPLGLTCVVDGSEVTLEWDNGSVYEELEIRRNGGLLATVIAGETAYTDDASPGTYQYELTGFSGENQSATSSCEVVDPGAPSGLTCSANADEITATWTNGDTYDAVEIYLDGTLVETLDGDATTTTIGEETRGEHTVCVEGVIAVGNSSPACCEVTLPNPVTDFLCRSVGDTIELDWANAEDYNTITVMRDGEIVASIPGNLETFTDTEMEVGTYTYSVASGRGGGLSETLDCETVVLAPISALSCSGDAGETTLTYSPGDVYDSIEIRRNQALVATLDGDQDSFSDSDLPSGLYEYDLVGTTGNDETALASCVVVMPASPFDISCAVIDGDTVTLNWLNSETGDSIRVERDGVEIADLAGAQNTLTDDALDPGTYEYCVRTVIDGNVSAAMCCTAVVAEPVTDLTCTSGTTGVELSWSNGQDYDSVAIHRDGELLVEISSTSEGFLDTSAFAGPLEYAVSGIVNGSESARVICEARVPRSVVDLTCSMTGDDVELSWSAGEASDMFEIYRNGVLVGENGGAKTDFIDEDVSPGVYEYSVVAVIDQDLSAPTGCSLEVLLAPTAMLCCSEDNDVEICWTNTEEYTEVQVYRDGQLLDTVDGEEICYSETLVDAGDYTYSVVGVIGDATSAPTACDVHIAGPTDSLECTTIGETTCIDDLSIELSWTNVEDFDSIQVFRDGLLIATVTGDTTSFLEFGIAHGSIYTVIGVLLVDVCADVTVGECTVDSGQAAFERGNANGQQGVDVSDPIYIIRYLFQSGPIPECLDAADTNDDGFIDTADPIHLLDHLFQGGPEPEAPFGELGLDHTCDDLDCASFGAP